MKTVNKLASETKFYLTAIESDGSKHPTQEDIAHITIKDWEEEAQDYIQTSNYISLVLKHASPSWKKKLFDFLTAQGKNPVELVLDTFIKNPQDITTYKNALSKEQFLELIELTVLRKPHDQSTQEMCTTFINTHFDENERKHFFHRVKTTFKADEYPQAWLLLMMQCGEFPVELMSFVHHTHPHYYGKIFFYHLLTLENPNRGNTHYSAHYPKGLSGIWPYFEATSFRDLSRFAIIREFCTKILKPLLRHAFWENPRGFWKSFLTRKDSHIKAADFTSRKEYLLEFMSQTSVGLAISAFGIVCCQFFYQITPSYLHDKALSFFTQIVCRFLQASNLLTLVLDHSLLSPLALKEEQPPSVIVKNVLCDYITRFCTTTAVFALPLLAFMWRLDRHGSNPETSNSQDLLATVAEAGAAGTLCWGAYEMYRRRQADVQITK